MHSMRYEVLADVAGFLQFRATEARPVAGQNGLEEKNARAQGSCSIRCCQCFR